MKKWGIMSILIVIVLIVVFGVYYLFFQSNNGNFKNNDLNNKNLNSAESNDLVGSKQVNNSSYTEQIANISESQKNDVSQNRSSIQEGNPDCGSVSFQDISKMNKFSSPKGYFLTYPEVKTKLDCFANNLINCFESKIVFGVSSGNALMSITKTSNLCVLNYESINKTIKCDYTQQQYKNMYDEANNKIEDGGSLLGYSLALSMGIEIMSNQETTRVNVNNSVVQCRIFGNSITTNQSTPSSVSNICTPKTCSDLGKTCGFNNDSCGSTIYCGKCANGQSCYNGQCCTPNCDGIQCGGNDKCGGSCPWLCSGGQDCDDNGHCVANFCSDSDRGLNFTVKGTITYSPPADFYNKRYNRTDYCDDNNTLIEYYCTDKNYSGQVSNTCLCSDGVCIS